MKISYSIEEELLGTGGGINKALHHFDEPFIVLSGDTWSQFNMECLSLDPDVLAHMVLVPNPESNFEVNLEIQEFKIIETGKSEKFNISSYKKSNMSNGFDDIDYLINKKQEISKFANNSPY